MVVELQQYNPKYSAKGPRDASPLRKHTIVALNDNPTHENYDQVLKRESERLRLQQLEEQARLEAQQQLEAAR